jgi:SAM-dependent methyltransferase
MQTRYAGQTRRRLYALRRAGLVLRFGDLGRQNPLTEWGWRRGLPVDRWYIERFLQEHAGVVDGRVLEVKEDAYASRLGAAEVEIVDVDAQNPLATVVGDLCDPATLVPGRYDAAILTQTLQFVADPCSALRHVVQSLRPGGTALVTVPHISRLDGPSDLWRWSPAGLRRLVEEAMPTGVDLQVRGLGNGLAARAFLFGLAAEDVFPASLPVRDEAYPLIATAVIRRQDS